MLKFPEKKSKWLGKAQSGFYIDFFLKKSVDVFIRNVFIYASLFFGEKYMIEYLTKKVIENLLFNLNKFFGITVLNYMWFFFISLLVVFYSLCLISLFYLFI